MPTDTLIRIVALCVVLAGAETLHGIVRMVWVVLAAFMAAFDIGIGILLMRKPWRKVAPDFDPRTGNYLSFGLAFLLVVPWLVWSFSRG